MSIQYKNHDSLSTIQRDVLSDIAKALTERVTAQQSNISILNKTSFEYFTQRILLHHAITTRGMAKENFEHAFCDALNYAQKPPIATLNQSHNFRGEDIEIDSINYSLKTEGADALKPPNREKITISKYMEVNGARPCVENYTKFRVLLRKRFLPHLENYKGIFMLRCFRYPESICYSLIEIPVSLFKLVESIDESKYRKSKNSLSVPVELEGEKIFTFCLDGSDEKITIRSLAVSKCRIHGTWEFG